MAATRQVRVVCAGLNYRAPGDENAVAFAMNGQTIEVDAKEAKRLIDLPAVVPVGMPAPIPALPVSDNPDNPFGGKALSSDEDHAAAVLATAGVVTADKASIPVVPGPAAPAPDVPVAPAPAT